MPVRAPRVCGLCGGVHRSGERCPRAAVRDQERKARFDAKRPSARQRGYTTEWEREAKAFLDRPENRWCACGAKARVVRHIIPIDKRPDLLMVESNWRPGCHKCNANDAARERRKERN